LQSSARFGAFVVLKGLSISNALMKLFIRFLAISKPKLLACMPVDVIQENCIVRIGSYFRIFSP